MIDSYRKTVTKDRLNDWVVLFRPNAYIKILTADRRTFLMLSIQCAISLVTVFQLDSFIQATTIVGTDTLPPCAYFSPYLLHEGLQWNGRSIGSLCIWYLVAQWKRLELWKYAYRPMCRCVVAPLLTVDVWWKAPRPDDHNTINSCDPSPRVCFVYRNLSVPYSYGL